MELLIGLGTIVLAIWGLIYLVIYIIRGGRKYIFKKTANKKKVDEAWKEGHQFVFKRNIYPDLILPVLWIAGFSALFIVSADILNAIFGIFVCCWFMVFKIYYVVRSRKDVIILDGNKIEFFYRKESTSLSVSDFQEANLEFRKISSNSQSSIVPLLIFGPGTDQEIAVTNAVLNQYPYEVTEALQRLNTNLKMKKSWNNTIRKKIEFAELLPAV